MEQQICQTTQEKERSFIQYSNELPYTTTTDWKLACRGWNCGYLVYQQYEDYQSSPRYLIQEMACRVDSRMGLVEGMFDPALF